MVQLQNLASAGAWRVGSLGKALDKALVTSAAACGAAWV